MLPLIEQIENNLDDLLINNNFDLNLLKENIKNIAIEYSLNYMYEKASVDDLLDTLINIEESNYLQPFFKDSYNYINKHQYERQPSIVGVDRKEVESSLRKLDDNDLFVYFSTTDKISFKSVITDNEDLRYKLLNNKFLFNSLRETFENNRINYKTLISFPGIDFSKVDKDVLKDILSNYKAYDIGISDNTLSAMKKVLGITKELIENPSLVTDTDLKEIVFSFHDGSWFWNIMKGTGTFLTNAGLLMSLLVLVHYIFKSRASVTFVFYKIHLDQLLKIFKTHDYFSSKISSKLLKYEYDFEQCSNYKKTTTPIKATFIESESFKLKNCFIKYIGVTFLLVIKKYKEYLKYLGVQVPGNISSPTDLLKIRDEKISIKIKNTIADMYNALTEFLDDNQKNKFDLLFKLIIQDSFDINRFEFDDYK